MADGEAIEVDQDDAPREAKPRWRQVPFMVLMVVLVVVAVAAGTIWWTHRSHDLAIGSRHRVTIEVREVHPGDCTNNISLVTVDGHHFDTDAHAPESWGTGDVTGTLVVTARPDRPTLKGTSAVFTADGHDETVEFFGGTTGLFFSDLTCTVS